MEKKLDLPTSFFQPSLKRPKTVRRLQRASLAVIDAPSPRPKASARAAKVATAPASGNKCAVCGDVGHGKIYMGPLTASICEGCASAAQGILKLALKAVRK